MTENDGRTGWIKIHRKILDHWTRPRKPLSKFEAWIMILLHVQGKGEPTKEMIKGHLYIVNRGESIRSVKTWATMFGWGRKKTDLFLKLLQSVRMIDLKRDNRTTHLTVINYDRYNPLGKAKGTQRESKGKAKGKQRETDNESNESNNEKKVLSYLNKKTGKQYRKIHPFLSARLKEYTIEDCIKVIDNKVEDWKGTERDKYLRPETLFHHSKFEGYLNQKSKWDQIE